MLLKTFTANINSDLKDLIEAWQTANPTFFIHGCKLSYATSPPKRLVAFIYYDTTEGEEQSVEVFSHEVQEQLDILVNASGIDFDQDTTSTDFNGTMYASLVITKFTAVTP